MDFAWIMENGKLTYIDSRIKTITGWTVEEMTSQPLTSLVASSTLEYIRANYRIGPSNSIVPRRFPVHLLHKDGHEVCCRVVIVCHYDDNGDLAEAQGVLKCEQRQCLQNEVLDTWPLFGEMELGIMKHMLQVCA